MATADFESFSRRYLQSYQEHLHLDTTNLDYYGVLAHIFALIPDLRGTRSSPPVSFDDNVAESYANDVYDFLYRVTGIRISIT